MNPPTQAQHNNYADYPHHSQLSVIIKLTIFIIGVFAFLQVYAIQAILPVLIPELQISEVTAGMIVGATVFGIALMSPITGVLSEKYGRKRLIVVSMLGLAIPTFLLSVVQNAELMIALRFIQGLTIPSMTVVTLAYIAEEYQNKQLAELSALYVSGTVLGGFSGRFMLGHLDELIGWRFALVVMGGITLCGALIVAKNLPASRNFSHNPNEKPLAMVHMHLKNKKFLATCILGFCILFGLVGCFTFINLHLAEPPYVISSAGLANIFAIYLLGVFITPLTVRLMNIVGTTNTMIIALICIVMGLLVTLMSPLWVIMIGLTMVCTGTFITQSAVINYIISTVQQGRSVANGLYYMIYYIGGSVGAGLCGMAYSMGKWPAVIAVLIIIEVCAMLTAIKLIK